MFSSTKTSEKLSVPAPDIDRRRSMEDEERPLSEGWVRQWDPNSQHHYYVDTRSNPVRSIWTHPDDEGQHSSDSEDSGDEAPPYENDKAAAHPRGNGGYAAASPSGGGSGSRGMPQAPPSPRRGFMGTLMDAISGPSNGTDPGMQQRYFDRRQVFQQNQGQVPPNMAGPMYGATPMYAPPAMPYMGRHPRREARRNARAYRRAVRRGYAVPAGMVPQQQAPLFGYR